MIDRIHNIIGTTGQSIIDKITGVERKVVTDLKEKEKIEEMHRGFVKRGVVKYQRRSWEQVIDGMHKWWNDEMLEWWNDEESKRRDDGGNNVLNKRGASLKMYTDVEGNGLSRENLLLIFETPCLLGTSEGGNDNFGIRFTYDTDGRLVKREDSQIILEMEYTEAGYVKRQYTKDNHAGEWDTKITMFNGHVLRMTTRTDKCTTTTFFNKSS